MSFQDYSESLISRLHFGEISAKSIRVVVFAAILVIIGICASFFFVLRSCDHVDEIADDDHIEIVSDAENEQDHISGILHIHVVGEVLSPGMVELAAGSRLSDAIFQAGGFTEEADQTSVNLASMLEDGQQVVVRSIVANRSDDNPGIEQGTGGDSSSDGKVNINTASESELQSLDGIGPSKAKKIVEYRSTNGSFKSISDLSNVSGIGDKTVESIKNKICI